jgi:hypothetical protein
VNQLPDFPVDPTTLDLLEQAMRPENPVGDRARLHEFLGHYSMMGGSDTSAVAEVIVPSQDDGEDGPSGINEMQHPQYTLDDVITSLITEVRRLRRQLASGTAD